MIDPTAPASVPPGPCHRHPGRWARSLLWCVLLVGLLGLASGTPSRAEDDPPAAPIPDDEIRERVAGWLEDLHAAEFSVRDRARVSLEQHGARARDLLEAATDDPDPEVRRTVRLLLERMSKPVEDVPPPPSDLPSLGLVRLHVDGTVSEALQALGGARGARFEVPTEALGRRVRLQLDRVPFYDALHAIASAAGLEAPGAFDASGSFSLEEIPADPVGEAPPWAAAGPLRVRAVEVVTTRALGRGGVLPRYAVGLDLQWEPEVQLVWYRSPSKVKAADAAGNELIPGAAARSVTTYGVGYTSRFARLALHLEPSSAEVEERLAYLRFDLRVRMRHDRRQVRFTSLDSLELPASRTAPVPKGGEGAGTVTLVSLTAPEVLNGPWGAEITAKPEAEPERQSMQVYLERVDGTVVPAVMTSRVQSADGLLRLSARAYGNWAEPPKALRVVWYRLEGEGDLSFDLEDVPLR